MGIEYEDFTMSMFANKEDLYKAKAEYYENIAKRFGSALQEIDDDYCSHSVEGLADIASKALDV